MTAEKAPTSKRDAAQQVSLPSRPHAPASHTSICDALLAFCQRATDITKTLGGSLKSQPIDLTPYVSNLTRIREAPTSGSEISLKDLANDLSTLVTIKLGSHLSSPDAPYWMAITTAFSTAIRTALPALSELVADTQSEIVRQEAQSTIRYRERHEHRR